MPDTPDPNKPFALLGCKPRPEAAYGQPLHLPDEAARPLPCFFGALTFRRPAPHETDWKQKGVYAPDTLLVAEAACAFRPDENPLYKASGIPLVWRYALIPAPPGGMVDSSKNVVIPESATVALVVRSPNGHTETWGFVRQETALIAATTCAAFRDVLLNPYTVLATAHDWEQSPANCRLPEFLQRLLKLLIEAQLFSFGPRPIHEVIERQLGEAAALLLLYFQFRRFSVASPSIPSTDPDER